MAVKIYYASRSFNGRMDVFKEGISAASASSETKSLARSIVKQAKKYAEYRNKFAHDQPLLRQQGMPATFDVLMVDGKGQFQVDEVKKQYLDEGVSVSEITYAATCFRQLSNLVNLFWIGPLTGGATRQSAWLALLQEQFRALPTLPRKEALYQPSQAPKSGP